MRLALVPFALALCAPAPVAAEQDYPKHVCLSTRAYGQVQGFGNFIFSGRVSGSGTAGSYGYWVVAIDAGEAAWAQSGGGVRGQTGDVRFGVYNGSAYPLSFVVIEVPNEGQYSDLRLRARTGDPLTVSDGRVGPYRIMSRLNDCTFDLSSSDLATAVPTVTSNRCTCP
ncbi:hypothetical protein [Sphingomonas sp. NIBR02145]|uniref:hypothetical protein n=1 Tax=Sphingomonas sp. NIBR02145 TaxID=3014784 RepID=UPI0022B3D966|nr:hypothetical protein [Sphingomonas sp. NIBR02145]WHU03105.1 hypothetical protein O3305_00370 [Sphingomonas sp. NIBR02145]